MDDVRYRKISESISDNYISSSRIQSHLPENDKQKLVDTLNDLKSIFPSSLDELEPIIKEINSTFENLAKRNKKLIKNYESILRKNENTIRFLYSEIFNLKIKNTFLENNVEILLKKEKEYILVKEKTGIVVENGAIIYNDRKDNEIFILRKENSTLKNVINNHEKEIEKLNQKYKNDKTNYENQITTLHYKISLLQNKIASKNLVQSNSTFNLHNNPNEETLNSHISQNYETIPLPHYDSGELETNTKKNYNSIKKKYQTNFNQENNQFNSMSISNNNPLQNLLNLTPKVEENGINFQAFKRINNLKKNSIQINLDDYKRNNNNNSLQISPLSNNKKNGGKCFKNRIKSGIEFSISYNNSNKSNSGDNKKKFGQKKNVIKSYTIMQRKKNVNGIFSSCKHTMQSPMNLHGNFNRK